MTTENSIPPGFTPTDETQQNPTTMVQPQTMTTQPLTTQADPQVNAQPQSAVNTAPVQSQPQQEAQPQQTAQPQQQTVTTAQPQQVQHVAPVTPAPAVSTGAPMGQPQNTMQPVQPMGQPMGQPQNMMQPMGQPQNMMQPMGQNPMAGMGGGMPAQPRSVSIASLETDIDDKSLIGLEYFGKLNKDQIAIVSPLMFNERGSVVLANFYKFYLDKIKKDFLAPTDNADLMEMATNAFGQSALKQTSLVMVYQYITDPAGRVYPKMDENNVPIVDKESGMQVPGGRVVLWRPSKEKIGAIRTASQQWGLTNVDLILKCTEDNFQKFEIQPTRARMLNNAPAHLREVTETANRLWKNEVQKHIPKPVDANLLRALIAEYQNAAGQAQAFGAPNGGMVDPFANAAAGRPAQAVGFGGGMNTGAPVYTGTTGGVAASDFGDMIATASQNYTG